MLSELSDEEILIKEIIEAGEPISPGMCMEDPEKQDKDLRRFHNAHGMLKAYRTKGASGFVAYKEALMFCMEHKIQFRYKELGLDKAVFKPSKLKKKLIK